MIYRILLGMGLILLAYYIGREIGRTEPLRQEMREYRERQRRAEQQTKEP
jgi:hypothetical protein